MAAALILFISQAQAEELWKRMSSEDPSAAYEAAWALAQMGAEAAKLIDRAMEVKADPARVAEWIGRLDAENPQERDRAFGELRRLGLLILPELQRALPDARTEELKDRLRSLIELTGRPPADPAESRRRRLAIWILKRLGEAEPLAELARRAPWQIERDLAAARDKFKPAVEGAQGLRAFEDLERIYRKQSEQLDLDPVWKELAGAEGAARQRAADYALALFKQIHEDLRNGRSEWVATPFWGGGAENVARDLQKRLAEEFASRASGDESAAVAAWLLDREFDDDLQQAAARAVYRIETAQGSALVGKLIRNRHPNATVLRTAIEQAAQRSLAELVPELRRLSGHHRASIRNAARAALDHLKAGAADEYRPEEAFGPELDRTLRDVAGMVEPAIPKDAPFCVVKPTESEGRHARGWKLAETEKTVTILDYFGVRSAFDKTKVAVEPGTLQECARFLIRVRASAGEDRERMEELSREGGLTGQFESRDISAPEALVGAWLYERGDRKTAAELLFPRIEELPDDRWLMWILRDLLGAVVHQEMLDAFCYRRDYGRVLALARHLSRAPFDDYRYQLRAKEMIEQIERRRDDFKTLVLPTPGQWTAIKADKSRAEQIKFLAERLRLLNCFQWGQPGGVSYEDPQYAEARAAADKRTETINPYVELSRMELAVDEVPHLLPWIDDPDFMVMYSYWRNFHPSRTMHRVREAVAWLINEAAHRSLVRGEDGEADRRAVLQWCRDNAGKSARDLLEATLMQSKEWRDVDRAASRLAEIDKFRAASLLADRMKDFEDHRDDVVYFCYRREVKEFVERARGWAKDADEQVRGWASLILLRWGDRANLEGLEPMRTLLAEDDGSLWTPRAIDALIEIGRPQTLDLACELLHKQRFNSDEAVRGLLLAGRREALDYLVGKLESEQGSGSAWGERDGKQVSRELVVGDRAAQTVAGWRGERYSFDILDPDDVRKGKRGELKAWLREQFGLIQQGRTSELKKQ
jgi:hypothetical protein